jgi:predicted MFS family arabinose efflux permease
MTPATFWAVCSAAFATAFGYGAIIPVLPTVLERAGLDASQDASSWHAGALGGLYMLAIVVCAPLWGALSDRFGRRNVIAAGLAGSALAFVLSAAATSLVLAYAARGLAGAFAAAVLPVAAAATAAIAEERERAWKFAGLSAAILLGYFVGPAVTAWLATTPGILSGPVAGSQYASAAIALLALAAVGFIAAGSGIVLPVIGYLAALESGQVAGAVFGALIAAGSLGQALGSFAGGAGYAKLGIQIFTAAALAMGLGAVLGARYRPPSSLVGVEPRPQGHRSIGIND